MHLSSKQISVGSIPTKPDMVKFKSTSLLAKRDVLPSAMSLSREPQKGVASEATSPNGFDSPQKRNTKKILLNLLITKSKFYNKFRGLQIKVSGRLRGSERTKRMQFNLGRIGSQTIKSSIQSNKKQYFTKWGTYGLTVYVSRSA